MSILFVAGPGRSGTTAFANYLNLHPQILVCRERYKFVQNEITPEHFDLDRLLRPTEEETNLPQDYLQDLLSEKDTQSLEWVGDKTPSYVRNLGRLHKNNPGSRFIVLYRPIEEVAESYDARSKNPKDAWLGGKNGFEIGVRDWNMAMKKTRQFIEGKRNPQVLIVSYHDFFSSTEDCIPLVSRFLEIQFDEAVRRSWHKMSRSFENRRRQKEPLGEEQARFIQENKDHESEAWILDRIESQWQHPGLPLRNYGAPESQQEELQISASESAVKAPPGPAKGDNKGANLGQLRERIAALEQSLEKERRKAQYLEARLRAVESRMRDIDGSKGSRISRNFRRLRDRLSGS